MAAEVYLAAESGWRSLLDGDVVPYPEVVEPDPFVGPWSDLKQAPAAQPPPDIAGGTVEHGEELTIDHVGPWTLQGVTKGSEVLGSGTSADGYKISNWPGEPDPSWYLDTTTYVYDNDPDNHGGVVPSGGLTIDGVQVPAGVVVVQFLDLSGRQIEIEGSLGDSIGTWPGVMFRGCRWRSQSDSVGMIRDTNALPATVTANGAPPTGGTIFVHYCDLGGVGQLTTQYCEIPVKIVYSNYSIVRNYISNVTTATQCVSMFNGMANQLENFIEDLSMFERQTGDSSTEPHLNGISINGGDTHCRIERNRIVAKTPDDTGSNINQTDCIAFFQDSAAFPGTGTNDDGTTGYRNLDNYLGGTGFCIYAGGGSKGAVANMQWIGNKWTTRWYQNGGANGAVSGGKLTTNGPQWGSNGNVWEGNTWADDYGTGTGLTGRQYASGNGPRVGTEVSGN